MGDESVDFSVLRMLQELGHEVWLVALEKPGITDPEVLAEAQNRKALLLTADKDFGQLVVGQGQDCAGVILLRLFELGPDEMAQRVKQAWTECREKLHGRFTVITRTQTRSRPLSRRQPLRIGCQ